MSDKTKFAVNNLGFIPSLSSERNSGLWLFSVTLCTAVIHLTRKHKLGIYIQHAWE